MRDQRHASIIVDLNFRMSDDENIELMMATRGKGSIIIINENESAGKIITCDKNFCTSSYFCEWLVLKSFFDALKIIFAFYSAVVMLNT